MKWLKIISLLIIALGGLFGVHEYLERRFCFEHVCFSEAEFENPLAAEPPYSLTLKEQIELENALQQPYIYLDRGKQSYAFVSQDRRFILKFFDFKRMKRRAAEDASDQAKQRVIRLKRVTQLIMGYHNAFRYDRSHSALAYVQLTPWQEKRDIVVIDWWGIKHKIPLSETPFVIQYHAVPSRIEIANLLNRGDLVNAKKRFLQLISMYVDGYKKGIADGDHNIMYNTGFVDGIPMRIDLGRLRKSEDYQDPSVYQKDLEKIIFERIDGWMQRHYPLFRKEILSEIQTALKPYP